MIKIRYLIKRNLKLFFNDKGMFFTSLITPLILLVLYATFLANIYKDTILANFPVGIIVDNRIIDGLVGGQLMSSLLAVSCVTVSFCSNFLMVQDKSSGAIKDLRMTTVSSSQLSIGYYLASIISTLIICFLAFAVCLIYLAFVGWYLSIIDLLALVLDIFLLVLFGTSLSSCINYFLTSQGQVSAVGSIISSGYGFICGAYMPISSFGAGLRNVISFLPGTYGTSLFRNHSMQGALSELQSSGVPSQVIEELKNSMDLNLYFFDNQVALPWMAVIVGIATILFLGLYIWMNFVKNKKNKI